MQQTMRVLLALVALCRWRNPLAQELPTGTTQQSNTVKENFNIADKKQDFVSIIRDDLRRNNDDYALLEQQNQLAYRAPPAPSAATASRPAFRKRMLAPVPRPQPPRQFYGDARRGEALKNQSVQGPQDKAFRSYTRSQHYKIVRANKLKQLLNKDMVRLRGAGQNEEEVTIDTLPEETRPTTSVRPPPPPPPTLPPPSSPPPPGLIRPSPAPQHRPRFTQAPVDSERQVPVLRQRKDRSNSPSPEQLDMAAARNPEITRIRLKGRLCQRSLMNLEGPTYDKLGKEVVPEYKPRKVRGRQFHQTRTPELLLPRCCNCCKKSVLGCQ